MSFKSHVLCSFFNYEPENLTFLSTFLGYMAVTGLPNARKDHAIAMCKFARDIREAMNEMTSNLSRTLGPDTDEIELRIGLNSGPVTAGVLRGDKSRFQLFGDTVK